MEWQYHPVILLECVKQNETEALEDEFLSGLLSCPEVGKMPRKPDVPCRYPGCSRLVPAGERYCDEHRSRVNSDYEKYGRDKTAKRKYGRAWKRIRDRYAAEHPFCELCYVKGVMAKTEQIHHKLPLSEGGTHDRNNLIALCKPCHSRIHAQRGDRWNRR